VRGIEVRLSVRHRHIDVVVFRAKPELGGPSSQSELRPLVSPLASRFHDFADYTTELVIEACGEAAPLIYRGVPVWERVGKHWELASWPRESGLLVQAG